MIPQEYTGEVDRGFVRHRNVDYACRIEVYEKGAGSDGGVFSASVVIPTKDRARGGNFDRLLEQIGKQTLGHFEVIAVVGDIRQGRAINTGAAISRSEILITMDDDTRLGDDTVLEKLVHAMNEDKNIGIAGVSNLIPEDAPWLVRRAMREIPRRHSPILNEATDSDMAEHPCMAVRKSAFFKVGGENELIPRGLDPYLRREIRNAGYRVVVIPGVWIHHLLPGTLSGLIRQYFRNGKGAAYCMKYYPQFLYEQSVRHTEDFREKLGFPRRLLRYIGYIISSIIRLKWIYIMVLISNALGFAWGWVRSEKGEMGREKW